MLSLQCYIDSSRFGGHRVDGDVLLAAMRAHPLYNSHADEREEKLLSVMLRVKLHTQTLCLTCFEAKMCRKWQIRSSSIAGY